MDKSQKKVASILKEKAIKHKASWGQYKLVFLSTLRPAKEGSYHIVKMNKEEAIDFIKKFNGPILVYTKHESYKLLGLKSDNKNEIYIPSRYDIQISIVIKNKKRYNRKEYTIEEIEKLGYEILVMFPIQYTSIPDENQKIISDIIILIEDFIKSTNNLFLYLDPNHDVEVFFLSLYSSKYIKSQLNYIENVLNYKLENTEETIGTYLIKNSESYGFIIHRYLEAISKLRKYILGIGYSRIFEYKNPKGEIFLDLLIKNYNPKYYYKLSIKDLLEYHITNPNKRKYIVDRLLYLDNLNKEHLNDIIEILKKYPTIGWFKSKMDKNNKKYLYLKTIEKMEQYGYTTEKIENFRKYYLPKIDKKN